MKLLFSMVICAGILASCQSGNELHYFKYGDNYYRIRIKEYAFLSSSRYQCGYYDENALDRYFGEIRRPDTTGNWMNFQKDSSGKINVAPSNTKLLLILSTQSEVISDQISAFAENEQTLEMIARLANKDALDENRQIKADIELKNKERKSLSDYGAVTILKLDSSMSKEEIQSKILLFVNQLAAREGRKTPFENLDQAYAWYIETF